MDMAAFGEAPAADTMAAEAEGSFSAANARKEISSGAVAARAAMFHKDDSGAAEEEPFYEPARAPEPAAEAPLDATEMKQRLEEYYRSVNPDWLKEHSVQELLDKVQDELQSKAEKKLNKRLKKKYGVSLSEFEAGGGAAA